MAAPLDSATLDNAIQLYLAGEPQQQILTTLGISATTLHRERTRRGIPPRREMSLPDAEIAAAYATGESELSLSARYGVSRNVIRRRLDILGVSIRSHSQAGKVRASKMTPEQRRAQSQRARDAWRPSTKSMPSKASKPRSKLVAEPTYVGADGRRRYTEEFMIARARQRQERRSNHSAGDQLMEDMLRQRGLAPVAQQAIGKYNVDVAVAPVAVEVLGGGWHLEKRHHSTRTPQILNAGWHLVFVWNREGRSALGEGAADYVVAFLDEVGRQPPTVGQYRVISGDGQLLAAGSGQDNQFPLVPPPRGSEGGRA
ncbi:Very-short-patch-repair endonuclease [Micromonospora carbonacea]|uniref:Very-short-patch-repair endonuclease n=1 Tax=Micromonospora carbonacea TaxID=47853 RepID=A0A1C5A2D7_9ACTN|nr:Very-short-patch-repair endonuclease [Micromonospora carbonacea]